MMKYDEESRTITNKLPKTEHFFKRLVLEFRRKPRNGARLTADVEKEWMESTPIVLATWEGRQPRRREEKATKG